MYTTNKIALAAVLLISCSACQKENQSRQFQAPKNARQFQQSQCILRKQQLIAEAGARQSDAKIQEHYCSTDACRDYWRTKAAEANDEYWRAIRAANSLDCFQ